MQPRMSRSRSEIVAVDFHTRRERSYQGLCIWVLVGSLAILWYTAHELFPGCSAYDISCSDISDKALLFAGKNNYVVDMEAVLTKDFLAHVQYGSILEHDLCVIVFVLQSLWRLRSSTSP